MGRDFVVKESKFSARVKSRWRYPRGKHSKVRQQHKGRPALPSVGYGAARDVRGKIKGLNPVLVRGVADLVDLDVKTQGIIVSSRLGEKKRTIILGKAKEAGVTVLNIKDVAARLKKVATQLAERKKKRSKLLKKKNTSKAKAKDAAKDTKNETSKKKESKSEAPKENQKNEDLKGDTVVKEQRKMVEKELTKRQ